MDAFNSSFFSRVLALLVIVLIFVVLSKIPPRSKLDLRQMKDEDLIKLTEDDMERCTPDDLHWLCDYAARKVDELYKTTPFEEEWMAWYELKLAARKTATIKALRKL
jgi:hypothetical protein